MDQLKDFADDRLLHGCIYCNFGLEETRDHVPSRVFLDPPFPTNLPVVPACLACNNGFSPDEEYMACLIECAIAGTADPDFFQRPRVARMLRRSPALHSRLESAKFVIDGRVFFSLEEERIESVILKLARGHAAFELSIPLRRKPSSVFCSPFSLMTDEQIESFDAAYVTDVFGEVGSRQMQRSCITQVKLQSQSGDSSILNLFVNDWVVVQEGRYRYLTVHNPHGINVKIIIGEFFACEVTWPLI